MRMIAIVVETACTQKYQLVLLKMSTTFRQIVKCVYDTKKVENHWCRWSWSNICKFVYRAYI